MKNFKVTLLALSFLVVGCQSNEIKEAGKNEVVKTTAMSQEVEESKHYDPKGNTASEATKAIWQEYKDSLAFEDERDFEEQQKGFIAAPESTEIYDDEGNVVWSMGNYEFLLEGKDYKSVHPSLQRQAILNMNFGLYQVTDGIYQVRGFDLANITFIEGETGWIVMDPLTTPETSKAAYDLVTKHLGDKPVVAVIYSHSHVDHFGGVRGVVNEEDVASGKVQVIAPEGFMEHAVAENVYAGTAMSRRLFYQYGVLLQPDEHGHVDQSIGKNVAKGESGLVAPNVIVSDDFEEMTVDGVEMVFMNTPGTEAPSEMNTYFPEQNAFWAAENIVAGIHNIYTLRGALVRDAALWSKNIDKALQEFGKDSDVMFASHSWPRWGNERIREVMEDQRDTYANLNNGVLHLANEGVTINEIHNEYEVPESLQQKWHARSYHGSVEHNSRAVINRYLGYWDANPSTLIPLSPSDSAPLYVEMMGGSDDIIKRGQELYNSGDYKLAVEILNKLVYAEPQNQEAKDLLADSFEQIGYQQESPSVRNSFLEGAAELRNGIPTGNALHTAGKDTIRAMDAGMWLDYIGIRLDSEKITDTSFKANLILSDIDEEYIVTLSNATLTNLKGYKHDDADFTITVDREDINEVMMGNKKFLDLIADGTAKVEGDYSALKKLEASITDFPGGFEIMPGTGNSHGHNHKH